MDGALSRLKKVNQDLAIKMGFQTFPLYPLCLDVEPCVNSSVFLTYSYRSLFPIFCSLAFTERDKNWNCDQNPCQNGGTCKSGRAKCVCRLGYTGDYCQSKILNICNRPRGFTRTYFTDLRIRLDRASVILKRSQWRPYWKVQFNTLNFHWGLLFSSMIVGMLLMISMRLNNRAAIVNKVSSRNVFFGSHIWRPIASQSNWLQTFGSRDIGILGPVFILRSVTYSCAHFHLHCYTVRVEYK